ncbi:MAG: hypothetical protein Q9225_006800 [Loekoesia sp. 1 TL-2023]
MSTGVGFAKGNVWSRAARRQQQKEREGGKGGLVEAGDEDDEDEEPALGFKVQLTMGKDGGTDVNVRLAK